MEASLASRMQPSRARIQPPVVTLEGIASFERPLRERAEPVSPVQHVITTVWRGRWWVLGLALLGGALAFLAGSARTVGYQAVTQIIVDLPAAGPAATSQTPDAVDSALDNHLVSLQSWDLLRTVLDAAREAGLNRPPKEGSFLSRLLHRADSDADRAQGTDKKELKALGDHMRVGRELRSRIISIGFTDSDPQRAAAIANLFAKTYEADLISRNVAADQAALAKVVTEVPAAQESLTRATNALEAYRLTKGATDRGGSDETARESAQLSRQLAIISARLLTTQAQLKRAGDLRAANLPIAEIAELVGSPILANLADQLAAATSDPARAAIQQKIDHEIEVRLTQLKAEERMYRAQINLLDERAKLLSAAASDAADRVSGLQALEMQATALSQRYSDLLKLKEDLQGRIASPSAGIEISSPATADATPNHLSPIFLIPPGMVAFGIFGAALLVIRRNLDQTLRGEVEAEEALKIPCIGLVPRMFWPRAVRISNAVLHATGSAYSRAVASTLMSLAPAWGRGRPPQLLLVTSSLASDGKCELAWSLALAASRMGCSVLLLNLSQKPDPLTVDFRKEFSTSEAPCDASAFLRGDCGLENASEEMRDIGITFMPAPPATVDLLPIIYGDALGPGIDQLRKTYDIIVINGPACQDGPEAGLLAGEADAVLFAVQWGRTHRDVASNAVQFMLQRSMNWERRVPIGSVLTQVNLRKHLAYRFGDSATLLRAGSQ
jgi:uncharacterized protein involved in exopolysaccharide biosynthesis/Mrp family chromosome partitioning ATPase